MGAARGLLGTDVGLPLPSIADADFAPRVPYLFQESLQLAEETFNSGNAQIRASSTTLEAFGLWNLCQKGWGR